jgi:catechol 2,3-dioxygenase-like lactoylglutathione lyase family enzyme
MKPKFWAGCNIAMKVPVHEYEKTVSFYRDILGFKQIGEQTPATNASIRFEFGDRILWIDRVVELSQAEIWLEIVTDDIDAASDYLKKNGISRQDEIEHLPEGFKGFWVSSPANIIHLIADPDAV